MARVVLDYLYLHLAEDPATFLAVDLDGEDVETSKDGGVRTLASGRRRAVRRDGADRSFGVAMDLVPREVVTRLEEWVEAGHLLLYREPRGRVAWGHVFSLKVRERPAVDAADVSFDFEAITYSEEV